MKDLELLRMEALLKPLELRSCWNCNPSHDFLKNEQDYVISCFECGRFYFKGTDITINETNDGAM